MTKHVQVTKRSQSGAAIGGLSVVIILLFARGDNLASITLGTVLGWLSCAVVYILADFVADQVENGLWFAYRNLAVMVAWYTLGTLPALMLICIGGGVGLALRISRSIAVPWALHISIWHWAAAAAALATARLVFLGLSPARSVDIATLGGLVAGAAAMHIVRHVYSQGLVPLRTNWTLEILLLAAIPVFARVYTVFGPQYLLILLGLVCVQVLRYRQINQARIAIERKTQQLDALENDTTVLRDRSAEMARSLSLINLAAQEVMFNLDSEDALDTACRLAAEIAQTSKVCILIHDQNRHDHLMLMRSVGLKSEHIALYQQGEYLPPLTMPSTLTVVDTEVLAATDPLRTLGRVGEFRSMIRIVLRSGSIPFGTLIIFSTQPRIFQKTEIELLETLAYQVSAALDNTTLLKALEQYAAEQAQLVHLSRISTASLKLETVIESVARLLEHMSGVDSVCVGLLSTDPTRIVFHNTEHHRQQVFPLADVPEVIWMQSQKQPIPRIYYDDEDTLSPALQALMQPSRMSTLALVPMVANDALLGVIALLQREKRVFADSEWRHVELATNQVAAQVHNAQRYRDMEETLERRLRQLVAIEDVAQRITSAVSEDILVSNVIEAAFSATQADLVAVGLLTEGGDFRILSRARVGDGWQAHEAVRPTGDGLLGKVFLSGKALIVPDNTAYPDDHSENAAAPYRSSLVVPLMRDQVALGSLKVESSRPDFFRAEHLDFLNSLAGHAVIALENIRLLEERQKQIATLTRLRQLSLELSGNPNQAQVLESILKASLAITDGDSAVILKYNASTRELLPITGLRWVRHQEPPAYVPVDLPIPARTALWVATTGSIEVIEDIHPDDHYLSHPPNTPINYHSMIFVPLKHGGQIQEVLCISIAAHRVFDDDDLSSVELLAIQAAGHLENNALLERIQTSSNRMRAILDSTREGIILLDTNGRLVEANASAERLLNIELEAFINQNFAQALVESARTAGLPEQETQDALTEMARILRLDPRRITTRSLELNKGGTTRYITEVGSLVYDINDHSVVMGRLLTLRDVTEEKLLASYRDEITKMAVHDLRSPLSTVISGLTLAADIFITDIPDHPIKPVITETLETATSNAQRLLQLVESILEISRMESRRMPLLRERTSMQEMFKAVFLSMSPTLQENDLSLKLNIPDDLPPVNVDTDKIRRVLINLLDNAVRFSPTDSTILLQAERQGEKILVKVADSGRGIPPEERERIFDKFTQIKENVPLRGFKGAGLGLAFCKLVLEAHGERIWVDSDSPLPGACFALTLPLADTDAAVTAPQAVFAQATD